MGNMLEQHHFNAIIYYVSEVYAIELLLNKANQRLEKSRGDLTDQIDTKYMLDAVSHCHSVQNSRDKTLKLLEHYFQGVAKAQTLKLSFEEDYNQATTRLNSYLTNFAGEEANKMLKGLFSQAKHSVDIQLRKPSPVAQYINTLVIELNKTYKSDYKYQQPLTNNFLISFLAHPVVRGFNSLALVGGLAAITVGVLATTAVITGLPVSVAIVFIAGGVTAGVSAVGLISSSFFRHLSPEESAQRDKRRGNIIDLPEMARADEPSTSPIATTDLDVDADADADANLLAPA